MRNRGIGTSRRSWPLVGPNVITPSTGVTDSATKAPQGPAHANSICVFSGLADGGEGEPAGPGEPPQNWGQIPKEVRDQLATQGEHPGDACNGHTGILAGGGEEP